MWTFIEAGGSTICRQAGGLEAQGRATVHPKAQLASLPRSPSALGRRPPCAMEGTPGLSKVPMYISISSKSVFTEASRVTLAQHLGTVSQAGG